MHSSRGFTLMELLVAITILALATTLVSEAFYSVTTTTEIAREEAARLRERQYIGRSLSENFSAVYTDPACITPQYALLGEDGSGPAGPGDSISFCTSLPMPGSFALPGQLRGVSYVVVGPDEVDADAPTAGFSTDPGAANYAPAYLLITEYPVVFGEDDMDLDTDEDAGLSRVRQVPITSMDILYYDNETEDWVDDWDSVEMQRLPWAIQVLITLARTEDEEAALGADPSEPDLDMTFMLPLGAGATAQFIDPNHYYLAPGAANADSIFNEDASSAAKKQRNKR